MRAVPKCPKSTCLALCFQSAARFLPDYNCKIQELITASVNGPLTMGRSIDLIKASPIWHSRAVHKIAHQLNYQGFVVKAPVLTKVSKIAYHMFHDSFHPPGATYYRLEEVYQERWCKSVLLGGHVQYLTYTACENLKWLSRRVPSKVHLANVRLHFNGWHTIGDINGNSPCVGFVRALALRIA